MWLWDHDGLVSHSCFSSGSCTFITYKLSCDILLCVLSHTMRGSCGTRDLCTSFPLRGIWQICASVQLECADQQAVEVSFPAFPLPVSTHTDPTMSSLSQALKLTCVVLVSLVSYQQNFLHCSSRVKWFDLCVYETGQHYESLEKHYERKCIFFFSCIWFHI